MPTMFPNLFTADPAAHVFSDGQLWLYADRDPARANKTWWAMCDYHAFSTRDLENWIDHGSVLSCDDIPWCAGPAWDGDCVERNGRYWYFFPMIDQIGVAVADRPEGPFRDAIGAPLITRSTPGIRSKSSGLLVSPVVVESPMGIFLYFGQNEELYGVELDESMTKLVGPVREVEHRGDYHEGPWVFYRHGRFHMIYGTGPIAEILEEQSDHLSYAWSEGPFGPFHYRNIVQADKGRTVQACLTEWGSKDVFFYHEDGPDNYHRRIRAEIVERPVDGGVELIPRGVSPVQARTLTLSARGRHNAEDYHEGAGALKRIKEEPGFCGFLHMGSQGAFIQFKHWVAPDPLQAILLRVRRESEEPILISILIDGSLVAALRMEGPGTGKWESVEMPLSRAISGEFEELTIRLDSTEPVHLGTFSFIEKK